MAMFGLTHGELVVVVFLFALVWGAGLLPRLGERIALLWDARERARRDRG